jgi:peptidoglycan/xylan/chitin deacetylase (PgdA/CDA1 family)
MNNSRRGFPALSVLALAFAFDASAAEATPPAGGVPIIMLKLDDLVHHTKDPKVAVSPKWQRTADFLAAEGVKANFGIITETLEGDCPAYVEWLKERHASGMLEFWNHGYYGRFPAKDPAAKQGEYLNRTVEEQAASLKKSQDLVKEKTGIVLRAFGPHAMPPDDNLHPALATVPEIVAVWFYGPAKGAKTEKVVIQRRAELEKPIFRPNFANLHDNWEKYKGFDYLALQGHPNSWDDQGFEEFKKVVKFFKEQGCRFMTISEYLATRGAGKAAKP